MHALSTWELKLYTGVKRSSGIYNGAVDKPNVERKPREVCCSHLVANKKL